MKNHCINSIYKRYTEKYENIFMINHIYKINPTFLPIKTKNHNPTATWRFIDIAGGCLREVVTSSALIITIHNIIVWVMMYWFQQQEF